MKLATIALALLALTGCSLTPDRVSVGELHVSHLRTGFPFGPSDEEATIDAVDVRADWKRGRFNTELGVGYMWRDGDFYGDPIIVTVRASVDLWNR